MDISLRNLGKRFNDQWVFRGMTREIHAGQAVGITGPNGSGKSTLIRMISGSLLPSEGRLNYALAGADLPSDEIYRYLSIGAPYMELIEELTLEEHVLFQSRFKRFRLGWGVAEVVMALRLPATGHKKVGEFSSGMKQRLRLGLAILADSQVLLLDEPTSNLDDDGVRWYDELLQQNAGGRLLMIASNEQRDYERCGELIRLGRRPDPVNSAHSTPPPSAS